MFVWVSTRVGTMPGVEPITWLADYLSIVRSRPGIGHSFPSLRRDAETHEKQFINYLDNAKPYVWTSRGRDEHILYPRCCAYGWASDVDFSWSYIVGPTSCHIVRPQCKRRPQDSRHSFWLQPLALQSGVTAYAADTTNKHEGHRGSGLFTYFRTTFTFPAWVPGDFVVILFGFVLAIARYVHYASRSVRWASNSVKQYPSSIVGASLHLLHRALRSWPRFYHRLSQTGQQHCEGSICWLTSPDRPQFIRDRPAKHFNVREYNFN